MRHFGTVALLALLLLPLYSGRASAGDLSIEKIVGAEKIRVTRVGKKVWVKAGDSVEYGDFVRTTAEQRVTILYADGTRLDVLPSSEIELSSKAEDGSQPQRLIKGSVRGAVVKGETKAKHRFTIRSRSSVMGVRGTDFVMALLKGAKKATVHVVEGTVDVATDEAALSAGQSTAVDAGSFVEAGPAGVGAPQPYDVSKFLGELGYTPGAGPGSAPPLPAGTGAGSETPNAAPSPEPSASPAPAAAAPPAEEPKKEEAPKAEESTVRKASVLSVRVGYLGAGRVGDKKLGGLNGAWSPVIPFPFLSFLWVRGHLGFIRIGDKMVTEAGALLSMQLLNRVLIEGGPIYQDWKQFDSDGTAAAVNVGLIPMPRGPIHSIYVGKTWYRHHKDNIDTAFNQWRIGIGIQF